MKDNTHEAISVQCLGLSVYLYVYNRINSNQLFSSLLSSPYNSCLMAFVESGVLLQTAVVSSALNTNESKRYERTGMDRIGTHRFNLKRFVSRLSLFFCAPSVSYRSFSGLRDMYKCSNRGRAGQA